MSWRYYGQIIWLGLAFFLHSLHGLHHTPDTYDDPYFWDKVVLMGIGFLVPFVVHQIQKSENNLKSTLS